MKDKEIIEEMAKDKQWQRRDNYCLRIQKALQYKGTNDNEDVPSILVDFENEIRKEISEDSVVLSREEYEKLKETIENLEERNRILKKYKSMFANASKETAEKILIKGKQLVEKWLSKDDEKVGFIFDFEDFIKEQFDVEIKE